MEDLDNIEARPSKRLKLDHNLVEPPSTVSHPGYVCFLSRTYRLNATDAHDFKAIYSHGSSEVEVVQVSERKIDLKMPFLKQRVEFDVAVSNAADIEVATTCCRLPSSMKASKNSTDQPIAKYHAKITYPGPCFQLELRLLWCDLAYVQDKIDTGLQHLLQQISADIPPAAKALPWVVQEFYDHAHVPVRSDQHPLKLPLIECTLYPFQDRATQWMLFREGVKVLPSGQLVPNAGPSPGLPLDFIETQDVYGSTYYVSKALSVVSSSLANIQTLYGPVSGGILAEAMGLGKTIEMIALMCCHAKAKTPLVQVPTGDLLQSAATLIITPPSILEQWKQEVRQHAPSLRVYHYTGIKASSKKKSTSLLTDLASYDVVLTTYNVIASEIHYVQEKPDRKLRTRPRREPPKSPLTQILWWRCLLDEAQMVESGVSNAAIVARMIPRVHAWAVTGTPLKQSHRDLYGLFLFLKYEPWCHSLRLWDYLVLYHRDLLRTLISSAALRHSREQVRDELRIPSQSRQIVTIPFSAVEEQHYAEMHYEMQQDVGVDRSGAPLDGEWDPNHPLTIGKMRSWLQRLRQTCLHPEVGGRNRRALGKRTGGPLRTVAQVLDVMIEQTDSIIHTERRVALMARADIARLHEHARNSQLAQTLFKQVYSEASAFVNDCRNELNNSVERIQRAEVDNVITATEEEDDLSLTTARQRLRAALEVEHVCIFFIGNTYFQLKEKAELRLALSRAHQDQVSQDSSDGKSLVRASQGVAATPTSSDDKQNEAEDAAQIVEYEQLEAKAYEEAKKLRMEMLTEARRKAQNKVKVMRAKKRSSDFVAIPVMDFSSRIAGGIETRKIFDKLYDYHKVMNKQAEQFQKIRIKMMDMLCTTLIDEEESEELTGEEYEESTKHQDEMYVVMEILRALFADRSDALSGQENHLLKQETKQFLRIAKDGEGHAPELMIKLLAEREEHRVVPAKQGSLRGMITQLRSLASSLEWQGDANARAQAELAIVNDLLSEVQKMQAEQTRCVSLLEQEVNTILDVMNARLDYYRALQALSDMVAPIGKDEEVGQPEDAALVVRLNHIQAAAEKKVSIAMSKRRYLSHLKSEQESEGEAKICTICQFEFEIGTLTVCGHQFCKECITMWWSAHRNCPVCKRHLHLADFYDVTYKPKEPAVHIQDQQQANSKAEADPSQVNSIYAAVDAATLRQIQSIDLRGSSFGSKVDTLVRHILHLRKSDPGSKTIIFSQYRDFLDVLSRSLRKNTIIHSKFDDRDGIIDFKSNPANECFLLHAKAHAAGLNLVCASHVILCEPLINTAIELQAVARVHRIGQTRATCVWMYLIEGTVEEAIYDISVTRRLAHIDSKSRDGSRAATPKGDRGQLAIEAANSKELQTADLSRMFASGKTGGELVDKEDLWSCLFGNANKRNPRAPARGLADLGLGTDAEAAIGARSEVGRFLRAEAAESRMTI